ncbi:ribose ABC transporter permease RbsC [Klebsiella variicola]|uniref:Ribose ABC transporter permease RbsC n=1 Tax=Klebsiella variicola TaxID=244366 RepID=A0A7H4MFJ7_KLEVA|nr:ribose ABC transporter permease RbsC [Klebsiella variicola]
MSQITLKTPAPAEPTASSPLAWLSRAGFGVITLLAIALFGWANPVFLTVDNWANLLQGSAILLIVAMAMTLIVSAGAIDLSVGVALDFGAAFALVALKTWHLPWQAAVGCALLGGVLIGLLNAFLILICRIRPFLATLGTWFIASSAERIYTDGGGAIAYRRMAPEYHDLAVGNLGGIPTPVVIVLALWLVAWLVTERTLWGKYVRAHRPEQRSGAYRRDPRSPDHARRAGGRLGALRHRRGDPLRQPAAVYSPGRAVLPDGRHCGGIYRHRL